MSIDAQSYASLAKDAYEDHRELVGDNKHWITLNGHRYRVIDAQDSPSGFQATAYRQVEPPQEIIIAYRGTHGIQDALVDTVMVADKVNPQEADARAFTRRVLKYATEHGIPLDQVTVTGHSLGGTLAEIEASRFGLRGAAFNAYGAVDLGYGVPEGGNRVIDYVVATDVVSAASRHYGQIVPLATPDDIDVLRASGYMADHGKMLEVAQRRATAAHSIDIFAPAKGCASILNPEAAALARANATPIAAYDHDVRSGRRGLRLVSQAPGTPVWVLARNAEIASAAIAAGEHLRESVQDVGQFAEREAAAAQQIVALTTSSISDVVHHAAGAMKHDARIAGRAIESGARTAREFIEQTTTGTEHAAAEIREAIGRGARNIRDGFSQRFDQAVQQIGTATTRIEAGLADFSNPAHPQHAVYAALKARMPPGTSEDRLAQCTVACHAARLNKPEHLGEVYVTRTKALFLNNSLFGHMAEVDLTRPAPPLQHSLRQAEQQSRPHEAESARFAQPAYRLVHLR